ncbi:hypothetical protein DYB32_003564 [Aphanomyces invadans]|uniref:SAP domain-containing protein n=1 Tax=Aphanomyces invadans TaxID=157072 RepID=A0A3R6Z680_9STRA|nr:hypothetical protein DYB32_003564 [Aphanomyces invadans]
MEHDEDHFRKAQEHISENTRQVVLALEQSAKEHSKWLAALCCSISLDIRRPAVNAKKRRLDLDAAHRLADPLPALEKRQKSIEDKGIAESVKSPCPDENTSAQLAEDVHEQAKLRSSRNPSRKRSIRDSEVNEEAPEELNPFAMKVAELKQALKDRGLKTAGLKASLIARLLEAIESEKVSSVTSSRPTSHGSSAYPQIKTDLSSDPAVDKSDEIVEESDASFVEAQSQHDVNENSTTIHSPARTTLFSNEKGTVAKSTVGKNDDDVVVVKKSTVGSTSERPATVITDLPHKHPTSPSRLTPKPSSDDQHDTKHSRKSRMAKFVNLHPPLVADPSDVEDNDDGDRIVKLESSINSASAAANLVDLVSPESEKDGPSRASPASRNRSPIAAKKERPPFSREQANNASIVVDLVSPEKETPSPNKSARSQSPESKKSSPAVVKKTRHADHPTTKPVPAIKQVATSLSMAKAPSILASPQRNHDRPDATTQPSENSTVVGSTSPTRVQFPTSSSPPRVGHENSPGSPKSPPDQRVRKESFQDVQVPSHPTKSVKAVALFDTTVSPYLPPARSKSNIATSSFDGRPGHSTITALDEPKTPTDETLQPMQELLVSRRPHENQPLTSIRSNRKLLDDDNMRLQVPRAQTPQLFGASESSRRPLFGGDISPIASTDDRSNLHSKASNSPPRAFSMQPRREDDAVGVAKSDLLISTAASLFASATSPIVKGFASFKSAFGLTKTLDNEATNSSDSIKSPVPKVPAPKVFQSKATFASKRQGVPATSSLYETLQARNTAVSLAPPIARPGQQQELGSSVKRSHSPVARNVTTGMEDLVASKDREFQQAIERESIRLRLAAKESAKKRIEREMDTIKAGTNSVAASTEDVSDDQTVSSSKASVGNASDPHDLNDQDEVTMSLPSVESSLNEPSASEVVATSIAAGIAKKPSNLVSGLHSLTSLVVKDSSAQAQNPSNARGAGPSVVSALRMAERNRLTEQKRLLDKKKRKEALLKKYEEQRKLDEERRKKATSASAKEQSERAAKELRLKKERETELAKKKQHRLQDMQALDEKKKQLAKEKEHAMKDKVEKMVAPPLPPTPSLAHAAPPVKPPMAKQNTPSKKELTNYEMSDGPERYVNAASPCAVIDFIHSDDSGNSDSECKKIPSWAQRDALEQALARQFGPSAIDPTPTIFPDFVDTCDLEGNKTVLSLNVANAIMDLQPFSNPRTPPRRSDSKSARAREIGSLTGRPCVTK